MTEQKPAYQEILTAELKERQRRNPIYSLRAFARSLGISPTMLSQIMQGRRQITIRSAMKIVEALPLTEDNRRNFLRSCDVPSKHSPGDWKSFFLDMQPEEFRLIADPVHFEILALGDLKKQVWDQHWIARVLKISESKARMAMDTLERQGLVDIFPEGFRQKSSPKRVKSKAADEAIREYHRSHMQKASAAIDTVDNDKRELNSITMAIDSSKLGAARELTYRYLENLHSLLDQDPHKDRVYTIAVQIFPNSFE